MLEAERAKVSGSRSTAAIQWHNRSTASTQWYCRITTSRVISLCFSYVVNEDIPLKFVNYEGLYIHFLIFKVILFI